MDIMMNSHGFYYDGGCNRNWGAALGMVIRDGCRQYVSNPSLPDLCLVCGCHRNFHQRCLVVGRQQSKRRFNRFTPVQVAAMHMLGEEINWDMSGQRRNSNLTAACRAIGVSRKQFRGWLHYLKSKRMVGGRGSCGGGGDGPSGAASWSGCGRPDQDGPAAVVA